MRGAANLINAIADGKKVAHEIFRTAQTKGELAQLEPKINDKNTLKLKKATRKFGIEPHETKLEDRRGFDLIINSLTPEMAQEEASRCLQCDEVCDVCVSVCPNLANFSYQIEPIFYKLPEVEQINGEIVFTNEVLFQVEQTHQILNIRDWCNECANCNTFCPTTDAPFKMKPHIHLSEASYNAENEGYMMRNLMGKDVLIHKFGEMDEPEVESLTLYNSLYTYENEAYIAQFEKENFKLKHIEFKISHSQKADLTRAASMSVIMQGARELC